MSTPPTVKCGEPNRSDDEVQTTIEANSTSVDGHRLEQVYRERARQFADRSAVAKQPADTWPVLAFTVGGERCGIATTAMAEVVRYGDCAPIPGARPEFLGVINLRGRFCSVLDLARILELPQHSDSARGYIVVVRHAGFEVGLRVDEVEQIEPVSQAQLAGTSGELSALSTQYVQGRTPGRLTVLDVEAILSHPVFRTGREAGSRTTTNVSVGARQLSVPTTQSLNRSLTGGVSA